MRQFFMYDRAFMQTKPWYVQAPLWRKVRYWFLRPGLHLGRVLMVVAGLWLLFGWK